MTLPLQGLKVVAVEQAVAAPFATARLADAGAEVIKIERPEGDFARGYDTAAAGLSSYFVWLNRGKSSVVLDLAADAGKAEFADVVAGADVLVQNLKSGALGCLGFDPQELAHRHPRLITCSITGYSGSGPMTDHKAYDLLIQAETGLCSITGGPSEPARVGISIVDIATGATAHAAILEALIARGITGAGSCISISMFDVMAEWMTVPLLNHEAGNSPRRAGITHPSISPYSAFRTQDGQSVLISVQNDAEWRDLCRLFLNDPKLGTDPRFATNLARVANRPETDAIVSDAFGRITEAEAIALLAKAKIATASVNDMAGLASHPHLRRITLDTPNGPVSCPAPAPLIANAPRSYRPVPALGERID